MASGDGRYVVTFKGEIYNYPSLRKELEAEGVVFRSRSDTEVLLHLFACDGARMVHRLRGMYAFAIWDRIARRLFLAREPYGIKPLYTANDGWTFRFASQVKALLAGGAVSRDPEPAGLVGFHLFGSVPEPFTLCREIRAPPAGHSQCRRRGSTRA
jgi:asparagine synthase (glutamine-hydrolysing)